MRYGPYEIEEEIGSGGAGVVYRARRDGAVFAVKLLRARSEEARARFEREARLLSEFGKAEGFVPLVDHGATKEGLYLVMPFIDGGSLRDRLRLGPLSIDEVLELARSIGGALAHAHAKGIVHRDVKPENILRAGDRWLLADLGLAKHFDDTAEGADRSVSLSKTGAVRGTIGYMAPEQLEDSKKAGPPADLFALGVVLYECLADETPFPGTTVVVMVQAVLEGRAVPLRSRRPDTPRWLADAIHRALAARPTKRQASIAGLLEELSGPPRRSRSLPLVGAIALVLAGAAFGLARRPAPPPPPPPPGPRAERPLSDRIRDALAAETAPGPELVAAVASAFSSDAKLRPDALALAEKFPAPFVAALETRREPRRLLVHAWLAAGAAGHREDIRSLLGPADPISNALAVVDGFAAEASLPSSIPTPDTARRVVEAIAYVGPPTRAARGVFLRPLLDVLVEHCNLDIVAAPGAWLDEIARRLGKETPTEILALQCLEGARGRTEDCEAAATLFAPPSPIRAALLYLAIRNKAGHATMAELEDLSAALWRIHAETREGPRSTHMWLNAFVVLETRAGSLGKWERAIAWARRCLDELIDDVQRDNAASALVECQLASDPRRATIDGIDLLDVDNRPDYQAEVLRRRGELDRARSLVARRDDSFALAVLVRIDGDRGDFDAARGTLAVLEARGGNTTLPATHGTAALRAWLDGLDPKRR